MEYDEKEGKFRFITLSSLFMNKYEEKRKKK